MTVHGPNTRVAMHVSLPITICVSCPFVGTVAHRSMDWVYVVIARPFVGIEDGSVEQHIGCHDSTACLFGRLVADNVAYLAGVAADHTKDGGRSLANVPCPRCLLARRRGGSAGSAWRSLFSPRILVAFIHFKRRAREKFLRSGLVYVILHTLAHRMHRLTGESQFPRQPSSGFARGNAAYQQNQCGRRLLSLGKGGAGQDRILAVTVTAAIGIEMRLWAE